MSRTPERHEVLTIDDVPEFPSGTATVYRVGVEDRSTTLLATLDQNGYLRTFDESRAVIHADGYEVLEVVR